MHAAVVKLDALPDAIGPTAQHHDFFVAGGFGFTLATLGFIGRIQISGVGFEFSRAGIHTLVNRAHTQRDALFANRGVGGFELPGEPAIRKAFLLERTQSDFINALQCDGFKLKLDLDDLLDLH